MSDRTFSLIDMIPEPLYFRDVKVCSDCGGDGCASCHERGEVPGERYKALTVAMLGAIHSAEYRRLIRESEAASRVLQSGGAGGGADAEQEAARTMELLVDETIALLVPDIPRERIAALPFGYKARFLRWWREQQPEEQEPESADPKARADERSTLERRSPALSSPDTIRSGSSRGRSGSGRS